MLDAARYSIPAFVDYEPVLPMRAIIADYLASHDNVTFIDLEEDIPGFSGELPLKASSDRNAVLWEGLSRAALHALFEMERQGTIEYVATSHRIYKHKGRTLVWPTGARHAKSLHWTPVLVQLRARRAGEPSREE